MTTMSFPSLNTLTYPELLSLDEKVRKALAAKAAEQHVKALLERAVASVGAVTAKTTAPARAPRAVTVNAVAAPGPRKHATTRGRKVKPLYRDPEHPENTWSGRGREPRWMTASGKPREAFRITA